MKLTAKISALIILIAALAVPAAAQRIRVVRSDVDSTRSGFITAKYIFGLDIYVDSVSKCNNVDFLLRYNKTAYIKYNGYEVGKLGKSGSSSVLSKVNSVLDEGTISIVVLAGSSPELDTIQNTHVIHLEFAVTQSAPHGEIVNFEFVKPVAVVSEDTLRKQIDLNAAPLELKIHSFIDVWPGDANNDGLVDHIDGAAIAKFVLLDPTINHKRSFKRDNAGTRWSAQRVLAWDVDEATYSDCDGNGYVTITDVLIVYLNHDSTHLVINGVPVVRETAKGDKTLSPRNDEPGFSNSETVSIPVKVHANQEFIGVAGRVYLDVISNKFDFIGMEKSGFFEGENCSLYFAHKEEDNYVDFAVGKFDKNSPANGTGTIAKIVLKPRTAHADAELPTVSGLKAISPDGYMFPLDFITSAEIEKTAEKISVYWANGKIVIRNLSGVFANIKIFNTLGCESAVSGNNTILTNDIIEIDAKDMNSGAYFAVITENGAAMTIPFFVVK